MWIRSLNDITIYIYVIVTKEKYLTLVFYKTYTRL